MGVSNLLWWRSVHALPRRLETKLGAVWFRLFHRHAFVACGRGAFMCRPFRIDGADCISIGEATVMQSGGWLYSRGIAGETPASLKIGRGCVFGYANHIAAVRDVTIGEYVLTANNVYISDNLHGYEDTSRPIIQQPVRFKRAVVIGDGCWIGENACIIGASVGKNSVVGANAVVTRDIPDFSVAVGNPAQVIRRFDAVSQQWVSVDAQGNAVGSGGGL